VPWLNFTNLSIKSPQNLSYICAIKNQLPGIIMTKLYLILLLLLQILIIGSSSAFEQNIINKQDKIGQLVRHTNLLKNAEATSEVIARLEAKENITIKYRQHAWYFISPANISDTSSYSSTNEKIAKPPLFGWVNMLNVRFLAQAKREGELGFSAAFSSMSKGTLPTVSTGVRGFDENDLQKSQADFNQVERLQKYKVSKESAMKFAKSVDLLSNNMNQESGK
jgi:hypothetical protein